MVKLDGISLVKGFREAQEIPEIYEIWELPQESYLESVMLQTPAKNTCFAHHDNIKFLKEPACMIMFLYTYFLPLAPTGPIHELFFLPDFAVEHVELGKLANHWSSRAQIVTN